MRAISTLVCVRVQQHSHRLNSQRQKGVPPSKVSILSPSKCFHLLSVMWRWRFWREGKGLVYPPVITTDDRSMGVLMGVS